MIQIGFQLLQLAAAQIFPDQMDMVMQVMLGLSGLVDPLLEIFMLQFLKR